MNKLCTQFVDTICINKLYTQFVYKISIHNLYFFNTYFGYQMFEKWGVSSIINIYSENYKFNKIKKIIYSVNKINLYENNKIRL